MNEIVLTYLTGPVLPVGAYPANLGLMSVLVRDSVTHIGQDGIALAYQITGMPPGASGTSLGISTDPTASGGYSLAGIILGNYPGNYDVTVSSLGLTSQTFHFVGTSAVTPTAIWDTIKSNFKSLIEGTIQGITVNQFHAVAGLHGLEKVPGSNFDRAYHVHPKSLDQYIPSVGDIFDYVYTIKLEIGYAWNFNAGDTLADTAIDEFEYVIKARLNPSSWAGTSIALIEFAGSKTIPPEEGNEESLTYAIFEADFKVRGRITY